MMTRRTYIYGLYDPRDIENIRYVGKADTPLIRLRGHINVSRREVMKTPVYKWVRKLSREGVTLQMLILCKPLVDFWEGTEQHVMDVLHDEGHDLLNIAEGGDGFSSEEFKRMWADPKVRVKHSAALKEAWADPEARTKHSVVMKEVTSTFEVRKAISERQKKALG